MGRDEGAVLTVDDDPAVGRVLVGLLKGAGYEAEHASSAAAGLARLEARPFDALVTDLQMPGKDGMGLLREARQRWPGLPVILLTAHGSVPKAVEAMRAGAADFMLKPFDKSELLFVVKKAMLAAGARGQDERPAGFAGIVGESAPMRAMLALVRKVAPTTSTVLVRGETGTGKELVARAVHEASDRAAGPLITVNCGALPDALLEMELFGHEKGAFTGAVTRKPGRLELAHGGTLLLDEIGDVSPAVQAKLLRAVQEKAFERVGGTETLHVDVRFVAATHRDLEAMIAQKTFREDLFYRLNVVPVRVPALRERPEDVARLAAHFCREVGRANGRPGAAFEGAALHLLAAYSWPGNVRQLHNLVERLVVLSDADAIGAADVARELGVAEAAAEPVTPPPLVPASAADDRPLGARRKAAEKEAVVHALARAADNRSLAARLLGVSRRTLYNKLREHGLE